MNKWNSTFKQKPTKRATKPKAKKKTKAGLWRIYGLNRPPKPRYEGLRGIYWYLLSRKVRQRDFKAFRACISCGRTVFRWEDTDAGHFIPASAGGFGLLFDERNVNMQHKACNNPTWTPEASLGYEKGLDERYGEGTAQDLKDRFYDSKKGTPVKEWSQHEYDLKILDLLKQEDKG